MSVTPQRAVTASFLAGGCGLQSGGGVDGGGAATPGEKGQAVRPLSMFSPARSDAATTLAALMANASAAKIHGSSSLAKAAAVFGSGNRLVDSPSEVHSGMTSASSSAGAAAMAAYAPHGDPPAHGAYVTPQHLHRPQPHSNSAPGKFPVPSFYETPLQGMHQLRSGHFEYGTRGRLVPRHENVGALFSTHATKKKRPTAAQASGSQSQPKKRGRPAKNASASAAKKRKQSRSRKKVSPKRGSTSASGPKLKTLKGSSRKLKALGLLCARFVIMHHNKPPGETEIRLSRLSERMGIERRRMYDCLNILESIKLVLKQKKDIYVWSGFANIGKTLLDIKQHADKKGIFAPIPSMGGESTNGGKSKSLAVLAHQFIAMFVTDACGKDAVTLDEAAECLARKGASAAEIKTKARRLYDIANICCTLELVEKFRLPGTSYRKPVYRWIGFRRFVWPVPEGTTVEVPCPVETFEAAGILDEVPKLLVRKWRQKKTAKDLMPAESQVKILSERLTGLKKKTKKGGAKKKVRSATEEESEEEDSETESDEEEEEEEESEEEESEEEEEDGESEEDNGDDENMDSANESEQEQENEKVAAGKEIAAAAVVAMPEPEDDQSSEITSPIR